MKKKGIVLIEVIMVILLLAVITSGITSYIWESLRLNLEFINQQKALYLAQAALMRSIADYRDDFLRISLRNINESGVFYYHVGKDADYLLIDATSPQVTNNKLKRLLIKNINAANSIIITNIIVDWGFGGAITQLKLGDTIVWSGSAATGANLDISDFTFTANTAYSESNDQLLQFSNSASGNVIAKFIFSDGSSCKYYLLKDSAGAGKGFSITGTGEIKDATNILSRRTLLATYDTLTEKIASWQESSAHIIP